MYEHEVVERLTMANLTIGTAESTVGGQIGHLLTNVPGASRVFTGGVTAYRRGPKVGILGVKPETIEQHGSVSEQVVREMAEGARRVLDVDIAVAESGRAEDTAGGAPGGAYYIAVVGPTFERIEHFEFHGSREETKRQATDQALRMVLDYLDLGALDT